MADGVYSRRFQTIAQMAGDAAGEVLNAGPCRTTRRRGSITRRENRCPVSVRPAEKGLRRVLERIRYWG